jgi:hypothetical protein
VLLGKLTFDSELPSPQSTLYEEIQLVEVELLPTFIVYRKSELLSPQRQGN